MTEVAQDDNGTVRMTEDAQDDKRDSVQADRGLLREAGPAIWYMEEERQCPSLRTGSSP